jgi:hypothetical protein
VRLEPETPLTWDILFVYEDGALGCTASPRRRENKLYMPDASFEEFIAAHR